LIESFGGVKIRHYGFLSSRVKKKLKIHQMKIGILTSLKTKKEKIDYKEITKNKLGFDIDACLPIKIGTSNVAKKGRMITVFIFGANAPPKILNKRCKV